MVTFVDKSCSFVGKYVENIVTIELKASFLMAPGKLGSCVNARAAPRITSALHLDL
jgi:hypothetical protein